MSESVGLLPTVVDTNRFVSGTIVKRGASFDLLETWPAEGFRLLLSEQQHAELADVFGRSSLFRRYPVTAVEMAELFAGLADATRVPPRSPLPLPVRDPKDEKILGAAFGGGAACLVTGDADLLVLRDDPRLHPLRIVTAVEFLAILDERERRLGATGDAR